jgi:hypothetical protein
VRRGHFAGLIDPVPLIGNGTRYAADFLFTYRSLLPALCDAPRYTRHRFDLHASVMARLADGYQAGYVENGPANLARDLRLEGFLCALDAAIACHDMQGAAMTEKQRQQTGGPAALARRLPHFLAELERLARGS